MDDNITLSDYFTKQFYSKPQKYDRKKNYNLVTYSGMYNLCVKTGNTAVYIYIYIHDGVTVPENYIFVRLEIHNQEIDTVQDSIDLLSNR